MQIGRNERGRIDEPKAGHAQHAVHEVAGEIALQVLPDELFVFAFANRQRVGLAVNGSRQIFGLPPPTARAEALAGTSLRTSVGTPSAGRALFRARVGRRST